MKTRLFRLSWYVSTVLLFPSFYYPQQKVDGAVTTAVSETLDRSTTFLFEENKGQWPAQVMAKADLIGGRRVFFENDRFTYVLYNTSQLAALHEQSHQTGKSYNDSKIDMHAYQMIFVGSSVQQITKENASTFYSNYFIGNDSQHWATEVYKFRRLNYKQLYPGIEIELTENNGTIEYDYRVKPGTDPGAIKVLLKGADGLQIKNGNLSIQTSVGEILERIPSCYQLIDGQRIERKCEFKLLPGKNMLGFHFPDGYDSRYELIIDPVVVGSTYSGSSAANFGHCATFDPLGNIYSGARSFGVGYPVTTGAFQATYGNGVDIAISKLSPNASALLYATYLGGSGTDLPHSLFVSTNNELLVYGSSNSVNYPTATNAYDNTANGQEDMVVTRLNATGTGIIGSTYIGGSSDDAVNSSVSINYADDYRGEVIADNAGNVFIAGCSSSANFPVTSGAYNTNYGGNQDAVVLQLNPSLTTLIWSTYLGGALSDAACSLRLSSNGEVYVVGGTTGTGFPTSTGAVSSTFQGGSHDGFVSRLNASGSTLINSTYIGTNLLDMIYFVDLDFNDDVYVYGVSAGTMPITAGVYSNPGSQNFVMKLNPSLNSIIFSTVLGNGQHQSFSPSALMVDYCQNVYLSGWGSRNNYPVTANATQTNAPTSCFQLMVLSQNAGSLLYSSPYGAGGEHVDGGTSRFDKNGIVYQGVCACGSNFPTTPTAYSPTKLSAGCDVVVFKINFEVNCDGFSPSAKICYGSTASFTLPNLAALTQPTFVVQPGNLTNATGIFSFSPTSNTQYSASVTGYNGLNALVTTTGVISVSVVPAPVLSPTIVQSTCTNSNSAINLGLSFLPTNASPTYTVLWSSIPNSVATNTQTSASGSIAPGPYQATVTTSGGCTAVAAFTVNPIPTAAEFTLVGSYDITCDNPVRTVTAVPASNSYTWTSPSLFQTGASCSFSASNAGTCQVFVNGPIGGCTSTQIITLTVNNALPTSTVAPLLQVINCSLTAPVMVSSTITPTVNCISYWCSPVGGTLIISGATGQYTPTTPGTHTHIAIDQSNGCRVVTLFTVAASVGFPTYSVSSPQNFTLGCNTKSVATINIINGQTDPPGGAVSYTVLPPGFSGAYGTGTLSTYTTITAPGQYTTITKDNVTLCESKAVITVLQNTVGPAMQVNLPYNTLSCFKPSVLIRAFSTTENVSYTWKFGQGPLSQASDSIRVIALSNPSATLAGTFSLTITDNNNTCETKTVIPILQNTNLPNVIFAGAAPISCKVHSVTLTNMSISRVPAVFNPTAPVVGYLWQGPSPQEPLQLSTTYLARTPGVYTLTGKDLNNGCSSTYTAIIEDNRDYPSFKTDEKPFILACGSSTATIYPTITNDTKNLIYDWLPNGDAAFTAPSSATTGVTRVGHYDIIVTNTLNGCSSSGMVLVESDSLVANFSSDPSTGFSPLGVQFTNLSNLKSNSKTGITTSKCHWSFGNGLFSSVAGSVNPSTNYLSPGTYTVVLFVNSGVCADTATGKIVVELPSRLKVPNVFSPNNDNINDVFFVDGVNLTFIYITITDRWGHLVYELESETGNIEWNGKNQKGNTCSEGVYFYMITANGSDGQKFEQSGTITLLR